jgi:hypothetical protein
MSAILNTDTGLRIGIKQKWIYEIWIFHGGNYEEHI